MNRRGRLYFIFSILFLGVGIVQCYRWSSTGIVSFVTYLFFFVPAIILSAAFVLFLFTTKTVWRDIAEVFCWIIVGLWGFLVVPSELILPSLSEVTSVKKYNKILNTYWSFDKALVRHFPSEITKDMQQIKFSFRPAFLQGGAHIQLRYTTSDEKIEELHKHFLEMAQQTFIGGDCNDHLRKANVFTTNFYTKNCKSYKFPDDYEIMVMRSEGFNHGNSCGVAISKVNKTIVYWAESW